MNNNNLSGAKGKVLQKKSSQNKNKNTNKPSKKERLAQSRRDKAKNQGQIRSERMASFRRTGGDAWSGVTTAPAQNHVTNLVSAIVNQDKPYILPRPAGTFVSPHQVSFDINYSISTADIAAGLGERVMIFRPELDRLVTIGKSGSGTFDPGANSLMADFGNETLQNKRYYLSQPFRAVDEEAVHSYKLTQVGVSPPLDGHYWHANSHGATAQVTGVAIYPFIFSGLTGMQFTAPAVAQSPATNITVGCGCIDASGNSIAEVTLTSGVASGAAISTSLTGAAGWAAYLAAQAVAVGTYLWFSYDVDFPVYQFNQMFTNGTFTSPLEYTTYSLWNSVNPSIALKAQYDGAELWNPTGFRVLVQNVTPDASLAGTVLGARLPAYAFNKIPGTPGAVAGLVSSQKHHRLLQNKLAEGVCYFYTPEKVQDYFFIQPSDELRVPFGVAYFKPADLLNAGCTFLINVTISYELITTDVSATMFPSASSEVLMNSLLCALSKENGWSENPGHVKHALQVVKNVMTSDEMKYALKSMLNAGVKIAPMVLSMLA